MKIDTPCIDICTGFGQSTKALNGLDALADKLHAIEGLRVGRPMKWDSSYKGNANWVLNNVTDTAPYILVGYSYGANTAIGMCKELYKRGREVSQLYLIDGVKRIKTAKFSWLAKAWSLNPWLKLVVPANVESCQAWRQAVSTPKGHPVYQRDSLSKKMIGVQTKFLSAPHVDMEDQVEIHNTIYNQIKANMEAA